MQAGRADEDGDPTEAQQQWESRAKDSEYRLVQICSLLIGAPDPLPFFNSVAGLSARIVGEGLPIGLMSDCPHLSGFRAKCEV